MRIKTYPDHVFVLEHFMSHDFEFIINIEKQNIGIQQLPFSLHVDMINPDGSSATVNMQLGDCLKCKLIHTTLNNTCFDN